MDSIEKNDLAGIGRISRHRLSEVLRKVKGGCITSKNVAEFLNVSTSQARAFLSAWAANGWLYRVRQGIYVPIDIAATSSDQSLIDPGIVANELFAPCYIGGWSAAQHWGFTEQIFESMLIITSRHINGKKQLAGDLHFLIKKLKAEKMFGLKAVWKEQLKVQVSDPHKTIIDMFDDPSVGGGMRSVIDFFQQYLSSSHFNADTLLAYASRMDNKTIFKRLGFVLSKINPNATALIDYCKQNISQGNSQLDPTLKGNRLLKKWRLWIPVNFEKHMNWTEHD
ncbi:MAG: type IV toxin-antitoxin system AbiEi family antitoxin domain-containing protein [Chlamydiales bacterium]|nr:type IV toxin-antitoxin system AbiEi family antitoxin domain-containing protein [Chlamydiales bacterium]